MESELCGSEVRFDVICDAVSIGMFVANAEGTCELFNRGARKLFGLDAHKFAANDWLATLHPADQERVVAEWFAAVRRRLTSASIQRLLRADSGANWVSVKAAPIKAALTNPADNSSKHVGIVEEITDRIRGEEEICARQLELQRSEDGRNEFRWIARDGREVWIESQATGCL
jgi:PAS domain S-box-containing protein